MEYTAEDFNHDGLYVQPHEVRHYNYLVEKAVAEGFLHRRYASLVIFKPVSMEIADMRHKIKNYVKRTMADVKRKRFTFATPPKLSIFQANISQYKDLKFDASRMFDQVRVNMKAILQQIGSIEGRKEFETGLHYAYISAIRNQDNKLIAMDMYDSIQKELMQAYQKAGVPMALPFELSGLAGGKLVPEQDKKAWVKPVVITAAVAIGGFAAYKGFEQLKKKGHLGGLGSTKSNKGFNKLKLINKRAKDLQHKSGYEMKNVKEVEVKTVKKLKPKLSWKAAQKQAAKEYRNL